MEINVMTRTTNVAPAAQGDDVVLMYPDNQLKGQVREFKETFSAFTVIKKAFFGGK